MPTGSNKNTELLIRLDEKMGEVLRRMGEQDSAIAAIRASSNMEHERLTGRIDGVSDRISALENFRWFILGASALGGTISTYLWDFIRNGLNK